MTDFNDNPELESTDIEGGAPEEPGNRNFLIVAGVLGGILILSLVCIVLFGTVYLPRTRSAQKTAAAEIAAQNTAVALGVQLTDIANKLPPTFTPTLPPTKTSVPTQTQVVSKPTESTPTAGVDPATATAAALYTQAAEKQKTATLLPLATKLPQGGFADEVGLPGLLALGGILLVVILVARRLRAG